MANTEFPTNTYRIDPYKNFKFRVKWDGKYVAGGIDEAYLARTEALRTGAKDPAKGLGRTCSGVGSGHLVTRW